MGRVRGSQDSELQTVQQERLRRTARPADAVIYYFMELSLNDRGSSCPHKLASTEHIFKVNCPRNNRNVTWLIEEHFTKVLPDDKFLGQSRHLPELVLSL